MILVTQDRVSPFGNLRIKACVPLPEAYRSLLRPSSPDDAKASINCCNWFMQTLIILGVYSTYLHALKIYHKLSKNKIISFLPSAAQSTLYKTSFIMVGPDGLEPSTPRLSSACSNQLSYEPKVGEGGETSNGAARRSLVEPAGFEPATPCLQSRCSAS